MGFFAQHHREPVPLDEAVRGPYAFLVWVHRSAVGSGRWPVVGNAASSIMPAPRFLKIDLIAEEVSFYRDGRILGGRVTLDDVDAHEAAAVWDAEHVEGRLADFFAGRPNAHVQCLKDRLRRAIQTGRDTRTSQSSS